MEEMKKKIKGGIMFTNILFHACIFRKSNIGEESSVNSFGNSSSADLSFSSKYRGE